MKHPRIAWTEERRAKMKESMRGKGIGAQIKNLKDDIAFLSDGRTPWCLWRIGMALQFIRLNLYVNAFPDSRPKGLARHLRTIAAELNQIADEADMIIAPEERDYSPEDQAAIDTQMAALDERRERELQRFRRWD